MPSGAPRSAARERHAASTALSIFTNSLNALILRAHHGGPLEGNQLEKLFAWAPQTSVRVATSNMREFGALRRTEATESSLPTTELTAAGRALLPVISSVERWLSLSPRGPIELDGVAARSAVRILISVWDSTAIRALAAQPLSLAELNAELADDSYPTTKRSLAKLRGFDLVAETKDKTGKTRYGASAWLARAIGPLLAATRWEQAHTPASSDPMSRTDVEAMFMLAVPLAEVPVDTFGSCTLATVTASPGGRGSTRALHGVSLEFEREGNRTCKAGADPEATTWGLGTIDAWSEAIVDGNTDKLLVRGAKPLLVQSIVTGIHRGLFR